MLQGRSEERAHESRCRCCLIISTSALRPQIEESPLDVVHAYQNNLAFIGQQTYLVRRVLHWDIHEYTTQTVRRHAAASRDN
jgi:hypothetical protein